MFSVLILFLSSSLTFLNFLFAKTRCDEMWYLAKLDTLKNIGYVFKNLYILTSNDVYSKNTEKLENPIVHPSVQSPPSVICWGNATKCGKLFLHIFPSVSSSQLNFLPSWHALQSLSLAIITTTFPSLSVLVLRYRIHPSKNTFLSNSAVWRRRGKSAKLVALLFAVKIISDFFFWAMLLGSQIFYIERAATHNMTKVHSGGQKNKITKW
jgi:hypothetical protein